MGDSLRPPRELDFSNTQKSWPEYKKRFARYRKASGLSDKSAERQINMLIYCMGREAEAIVNQIKVRAPRAAVLANKEQGIAAVKAEDAEGTLYDRTVEALDAYFTPRDNHLHYEVLFMSRSQFPERVTNISSEICMSWSRGAVGGTSCTRRI